MRAALLLVLAACGVEADSKPASLPATVRGVAQRMHARYTAVRQIEHAIVAGRLDEVRVAAHSIATLDEPEVLPEWQPYFAAVQSAARDLEAAEDIVGAAALAGQLGLQCATCHQAIDAHVSFRGSPKPDAGPRLAATMAAHHWGTARMWEGVIGPNDERWNAGAKALQRAPLTFVAESGQLGLADDVVQIRLLARRAMTTRATSERAELFGRLLGTCARCHATIRDDAARR